MRKLTTIAAAVSSALVLGYGPAAQAVITAFTPAGYAESEMLISNFRIINNATGLPPVVGPGGPITSVTASIASTLSASINGVPGVPHPTPSGTIINPLAPGNPGIDHSVEAGPNAANYVPFTSYPVSTLGAGVFAGAVSQHSGNGLGLNGAAFTTANTQAQVNVNGATAFGSADSRQTLATTSTISVVGTVTLDVFFDAATFMRIALGQPGVVANAVRTWGLTVRPVGSLGDLLSWNPQGDNTTSLGGACVGAATCSLLGDPFDLNFEASTLSTFDADQTFTSGGLGAPQFGVRFSLISGEYTFSIRHITNVDVAVVPEPGSLALLGAALVALTGMRRKSKA